MKNKTPYFYLLILTIFIALLNYGTRNSVNAASKEDSPVAFSIDDNFSQSTLATNTDTKYIKISIPKGQLKALKTSDYITINLPEIVVPDSATLLGGTSNEVIIQDGTKATLKFNKDLDLSQATQNIDFYVSFRVSAQNRNQKYPVDVSFSYQNMYYKIWESEVITNTTNIGPSGTWIVGSGYQNDNLIFADGTINSLLTQDASDDTNKYATFTNEGPYVSGSAIYNILGNEKADNGAVWFKLDNNLDLSKIYMWNRMDSKKPILVTRDETYRVIYTSNDKREGYIELNSDELQETALQVAIVAKTNDSLPADDSKKTYHLSMNALYNLNPLFKNKEIYDNIINPNNGKFRPNIQLNYGNTVDLNTDSNFDFSNLATITDTYDGDVTKKVSPAITKNGDQIATFNPKESGNYNFNYAYTNSYGIYSSKDISVNISNYNPDANPSYTLKNSSLVAGPKSTWNLQDNITPIPSYYEIDNDGQLESIDTRIPGIHSVYFAEYDYQKNVISKTIGTVTVNVLPTKAKITTKNSRIEIGNNWNPSDNIIEITDAYGRNIPFNPNSISGSVNTNIEGSYPITYSYEDIAGNKITSNFTVSVYHANLANINFEKDSNNNYKVIPINSDGHRYTGGTVISLPGFNNLFTLDENGTFLLTNDILPASELSGKAFIFKPLRSNDIQVTIPRKNTSDPTPEPDPTPQDDTHPTFLQSGLVHYFNDYGVMLWTLDKNNTVVPLNIYQPANSYVPYYGDFVMANNTKYFRLANTNHQILIQAQYLLDAKDIPETIFSTTLTAGNAPYNISLRNSIGNLTSNIVEPDTIWKVFAKKTFYGHTYYRLGNNDQWIEDTYVTSIF